MSSIIATFLRSIPYGVGIVICYHVIRIRCDVDAILHRIYREGWRDGYIKGEKVGSKVDD